MVSSKTTKTISLAISLLVVVISLTGVAQAATAPTVSTLARYTPGFAGIPGKLVADAAGNMFATDFWGKGIVKLNRQGAKLGFISTDSRPTAVAVKNDGKLIVAMSSPRAYVAFYSQTGDKLSEFAAPAQPFYRPSGIAIDASGNIYVLDSGDNVNGSANLPLVKVFASDGSYLAAYGSRTPEVSLPTANAVQFKVPAGIAYEKASNKIVVADSGNGRLLVMNPYPAGTYDSVIGVPANPLGAGMPTTGVVARFGDPTDIAYEYSSGAVERIFVTDRSRHDVVVVEPGTAIERSRINSTTVSGGKLRLPSGVVYQQTGTVVATGKAKGVLYVTSGSIADGDNVVAFSLDAGTATPEIALAITSTIAPTSITTPLAVSGTISPVYPVNCSVNGGADVLATPSGNNWSVNLPLTTGYNNIVCKATDGSLTVSASGITYYNPAPPAGPLPTITVPNNGIFTANSTIDVSGTTTVANATVKVTNALNGSTFTTVSDADMNWSGTVTLVEGANTITAEAYKDGTDVQSDSITVNADFTSPTMTVSFLANGSTTVNAIQNLDGIVVEKNLSSVTVNGEPAMASVDLPTADNTYFSVPVTLVRGSNTIEVVATDLAGHSFSITRTVILNPEIPGLTVDLPAGNSYRQGAGTTNASGTADTTFTLIDACGIPVTPASGNWSTAVMPVAGGFATCEFAASGGGNVTVKEKRSINADPAYAMLAITSPSADIATNSSSVVIAGTVSGGSAPTISVDGDTPVTVASYNSGTGAFSHSVDLVTEGLHYVKVAAADGITTAIRNIVYDSTAPVLAIQSDTRVAPVLITGAIEPSAKLVSVVVNETGGDTTLPLSAITFASMSQGAPAAVWTVDLTGHEGYNSVSFTTADPAGNEVTRAFVNGIPSGDVDMDGVVRLSDALACLRHVAATELLSGSPTQKDTPRFQADVGSLIDDKAAQDGEVTVVDSLLILQKAYGLRTF